MSEEKMTRKEYGEQMVENYIETANVKKIIFPKIINMKALD